MARTYNSKQVYITYGPHILTEPAPGDFCSIVKDEDDWSLQIGAHGEGARSASNNNSYTITVTLMQTSPSNVVLSSLAKLDKISAKSALPLMIKDASGGTIAAAASAWIQKVPDVGFGVEAGTREWVFRTDNMEVDLGGGNP